MPSEATVVDVITTIDMYNETKLSASDADYIIMAAAPSDYITEKFEQKIKSQSISLELTKTVDIAAEIGKIKGKSKLIVFAAETENLIENATNKMLKKNADMAVANDVTMQGAGFNVDTNIVTLITKNENKTYPILPKSQVATLILDEVIKL